jgi:hypothetical protein
MNKTTSIFREHPPRKLPNCKEAEPDINADESSLTLEQRAYLWTLKYLWAIHADWVIYNELFVKSRERVEELNRHAGAVFHYMQFAQSDRVALGIAKLIDDKGHMLSRLSNGFALRDMSKAERKQIEEERVCLRAKCENLEVVHELLMTHRDKRIAHNDFAVYTSQKTIDDLDIQTIQRALDDVSALFAEIAVLRYDVGIEFCGADWTLLPACDQFLKVIEYGNAGIDKRIAEIETLRRQMSSGEMPVDFDPKMLQL